MSVRKVVATTVTDLHREPSFLTELLTQVLNGTELEVLRSDGEWCQVRQLDGYEGWAYAPYLADASEAVATTHLVSDAALALFASRDESLVPLTRLPIGMAVRVEEQQGDWARIKLAGKLVPTGWATVSGLRAQALLPLTPEAARTQIVADARRLTGVYYLWGGNTAWGTDCSGLSQLCHRLAGYTLPRDARQQYPAGKIVEPPFQPGDLLFFHGESSKDRITHVGISTGGWHMIHSSRSRNGVYEEDLQSEACSKMRSRFVGARTFLLM